MQYIEAPDDAEPKNYDQSLFLAGGITNCPDWQSEMVKMLQSEPITIFNPRRANFPIDDSKATYQQIAWEYIRLHKAKMISFWFSYGSPNPIVFFELGAALERQAHSNQKLIIGCHPDFERKADVIYQVRLMLPSQTICMFLSDMAYEIKYTAQHIRNEKWSDMI